jgi:phosphatidylglycerophosphate synthase
VTLALYAPRRYSKAEVVAAGRERDSWWTVLMVDPTAMWLVRRLAGYTPITPNQLSAAGAMFGIAAAGAYLFGDPHWAVAGGVLFQLGFLLDCMDGRLARLTGQVSVTGAWLNEMVGRARLPVCAVALMVGRYSRTGQDRYLLLALLVLAITVLWQLGGGDRPGPARIGFLARRRLRTRPVGEVEFAMAVCVFAPQTGAYLQVITVAAALLLAALPFGQRRIGRT